MIVRKMKRNYRYDPFINYIGLFNTFILKN